MIKQAVDLKKPISIVYDTKTFSLLSCQFVSQNSKTKLSKEFALLSNKHKSIVEEVQTSVTDSIGVKMKTAASTQELISLFNFLVGLSCKNSTTCTNGKMPCITFQYKANGCQARAHLMRYYIEDSFKITSKKVFLFGSLHAKNSENCGASCISWGWHVAPLINEIDSSGIIIPKVIDPSLFNRPVTVEEWKNAQINCSATSSIDTMYIVESKFYSWDYTGSRRNKTRYFYEDEASYGKDSYTIKFLRPRCKKCN